MRHRFRATLLAAMLALTTVAASAQPAADAPASVPSATTFRYPAELPPETAVHEALARLPELQAARAGLDHSAAERRRLQSGPYEWSLRGETARRRTHGEGHSQDYEIAVERPLRWFGKAAKDEELGQQTVTLAQAAHADAWHEASRALLAAWFELLREQHAALRTTGQVELNQQLLDRVERRVRAGESPRMELLLAQTEHERLIAARQQAEQRAALARIALQQTYPGLPLPDAAPDAPLPELADDGAGAADWAARILADNHELQQAQAQTREKQLQAERSALDRAPDPTLSLRYTSERDSGERMLGVGVSIPLPGPARGAAHAGALAQVEQARQQELRARAKVEREARQLVTQAEAARKNAAIQARIRQQAQSNAALVAKAYALGESAFADTLLATRQALEAAQAAETAQLDALELHARLLLDAHLIWALEHE